MAQHGSSDRTQLLGYRIMNIGVSSNGSVLNYTVFAEGWLQSSSPPKYFGRQHTHTHTVAHMPAHVHARTCTRTSTQLCTHTCTLTHSPTGTCFLRAGYSRNTLLHCLMRPICLLNQARNTYLINKASIPSAQATSHACNHINMISRGHVPA